VYITNTMSRRQFRCIASTCHMNITGTRGEEEIFYDMQHKLAFNSLITSFMGYIREPGCGKQNERSLVVIRYVERKEKEIRRSHGPPSPFVAA
jgi:hypothetical protein